MMSEILILCQRLTTIILGDFNLLFSDSSSSPDSDIDI